MSTAALEKVLLRDLTEESAFFVETFWYSSCETKSKNMIQAFGELGLVRHSVIDNLLRLLQSDSEYYIVRSIWGLKVDDRESFTLVRNAAFELISALKEALEVADLHISQIATELDHRLNGTKVRT
jgi:hypothetical protein